jgi:V8-like Glu-specific endopeptidase
MTQVPARTFRIAAAAGLALGSAALGQMAPPASHEVPVSYDSGPLADLGPGQRGGEPVLAWAQDITVPDAAWVRVHFGRDTVLAGPDRDHGGSYLVITSVEDGARHILDAKSIEEWDRISAFLNGQSVLVQLFTTPGAGANRVTITEMTAGDNQPGTRSICGTTDDRVPFNDPRAGRLSVGCTAWMISSNTASNEFLTAGHCISNGQTGVVVMFNVPPSTSSGGLVNPPPEFQFPVQSASIQSLNGGIGNDFARFNTSNNSNTGMAPRVAQGRSVYALASSAPASGTADTTVRGYGVVNQQGGIPAVPNQWNEIGQTHTGPYAGKSGTAIRYFTDTEGGNSGSPVTQLFSVPPFLFEFAIGVHTNAGCPGTFNTGTAIELPSLQAAIATPSGVAVPFNSAISKGLSTTLASDNGGSDGGSIFFDVTTGSHALEVTSFNLNINRNGTTSNATTTEDDDFFNFSVYTRPGTAAGFQGSSAGWTLVAQGAGMPKPEDEFTLGALKNTFTLNAFQSYGIAIVLDSGAGFAYTNGTGTNETYSNADLTFTGISASNTPFGAVLSPRVFNGTISYDLNQASGQCLETIYASNNQGSNGGMVYFNVTTGPQPVTLTGLNTNVTGAGALNCSLTLYRKVGTHVGFENNPGAWTQVATASGTSQPVDTPSPFALSNFVSLNANTTYGFALELQSSGTDGHAYTNGTGLNQGYSDDHITINTGSATNVPFSGQVFTPRVWNGSFCYGVGLAPCSNPRFTSAPPDATIGAFNSEPGGQEEADNFSISGQNWSLNSATLFGTYSSTFTSAPTGQDFVIRIFQDSGGVPGALVASRTISNVPPVDTGLIGTFGVPIYQYTPSFAAINLGPGSYWISALGNTTGYTWAWNRTNTAASGHAVRNGAGAWALSSGDFAFVLCGGSSPVTCYANCDNSTVPPILNVLDFNCFLNAFAAGASYANCDNSTIPPVLNVLDFNCFLNRFAAGCP